MILKCVLMSAFISALTNAEIMASSPPKSNLSGKVTNLNTGEPLPGVSIYLPDLKTGAQTNAGGIYLIEDLPSSRVLVQVSLIGYNIIAQVIDLSQTSTMDFQMRESVNELNEVVVTGMSEAAERNRTPTPVTIISPSVLLQAPSTNIIESLARQPGLSQITTGPGISKPVVRGLGYNRIIVLHDGVRQEGQQWGDEHGVEVDEFSVSKVEILKGPASIIYGSDALAGVINLISAPTLPEGNAKINLLTNYQTNNGLYAASLNSNGNFKGYIWDLRYSNKRSHAYKNKNDGFVYNSNMKESNAAAILGVNKSWGYSHLHLSSFSQSLGIVEGARDSATGKFIRPVFINDIEEMSIVNDDELKTYIPGVPYQKINHYRAVVNNSFVIKNSSVKLILGWQQNERKEFDDAANRNNFGLYFHTNTVTYDTRYVSPTFQNSNITVGINGMIQNTENRGIEFLIPDYTLSDFGIYATGKKSIGRLDLSGGLRYDTREINGDELLLNADGSVSHHFFPGVISKFKKFNSTFQGITGSVGATYQFTDKSFTKINLARGFRSPNISELGSNGIHEGSLRYEIGQPDLNAEKSMQLDVAFGIIKEHITAEIDLFTNTIDDFIYVSKLNSIAGGDSIIDGNSVFKYTSGNAGLSGGELTIDLHPHPLDWLHFENSVSYVSAILVDQPDSSKYLPFTPPVKITSEIKTDIETAGKTFRNMFFRFSADNYLKQVKYYRAFNTETETRGYTLLSFGFGTDVVKANNTLFTFYISVTNLADKTYQSHLSRLKYAEENNLTGRRGVFNMGRNISFKLIIPVTITKK